ncbi:dihydroneopterin aldolase [Micrococcus terreus]|uniref:dihydroneopterin aldolase n=1 Tax=Micrococcus terreus TaxID=574650 RepID=UPI003D721291
MTGTEAAPDTIALRGLRARGFHGVFEHERREGQDFITDVLLHLDAGPAASQDELASTANYAEVAATVERIVTGDPVDLIETVALRIATAVLQEQPVAVSVEVTVHKPQAPIPADFADVSVTVRRSRT